MPRLREGLRIRHVITGRQRHRRHQRAARGRAAHALEVREPYGVWGGLSEDEREAIYRRQRRSTAVAS